MREMKDSGVEWIGEIDATFKVSTIGSLFSIKKEIIGCEPERVLSITQTGIRPKDTESNEGQNANTYEHYQIVNCGDFAMNHMDLLTGWIDISKFEGVTSPDYRVFILKDPTMIPEYFLRVFQYYYSNRVFFGFGQGVATLGRWRLPAKNFETIIIPLPPVEKQKSINAAIEIKASLVDSLITNAQTQIEKLKQYKQSLITEVVTKGLDPTVPMKDSGVEWIGEIPEHWSVLALKYLCSMQSGKNLISDQIADEGEYPVYGGNGLRGYFTDYNTDGNFLLIGRQGALCGNVHKVNGRFWATEHAVVTKQAETVCLDYLFYLLIGMNLNQYVSPTAAQPGLAVSTILNIITCLPPYIEQIQAVESIKQKCAKVDSLISIKQAKIEKLNAYKKSLIYEYVTGKREVKM